MLGIEAQFDDKFIDDLVDGEVTAWFDELMEDCRAAGRKFVDGIRAKSPGDSWNNITWNLRSSIGYLIIHDGEIKEEYFPAVGGGLEGSATGRDYAREIGLMVNEYEGVQLVIVAGMEYAVFLEDRSIDVLTGASKRFPKILIRGVSKFCQMRKSGLDVVQDIRKLINVPEVTQAMGNGKIYQFAGRPGSNELDIVISLLGNSNDLFQEATVNVIIHIPTLSPPAVTHPQPDLGRFYALLHIVTPLLDCRWRDSFNTEVADEYLRQESDGSWFYRLVVDYQSYNNEFENI